MWFITRPIAFSLPGIARAEITTRSGGAELDVAVIVDRDARERRVGFALRTGGQAQHVLRRIVGDVAVANQRAGRDASDSPSRCAICEFSFMPRPTNATLRSNCTARSTRICMPIDARRERRDDELALGAGEDLLEGVFDVELRSGVAAPIDVRAVAEHRQHALGAQLREAVQVERLAAERRLIDLEVAGVDQHALRRADRHRHAVRHAVRDADELDLKGPDRERRRAA